MQFRNRCLEAHGMLIVTGDISGSSCASTIFIQCFVHRLQDLGISSHAKIIIGAPDRDSLVLVRHVRLREFLRKAIDVVEVAVRLILMLLVQLGIVKLLVIELDGILVVGSRVLGRLTGRFDMLRIWH